MRSEFRPCPCPGAAPSPWPGSPGGRCPWRCDSCGTSIAGREPASEFTQAFAVAAASRAPCSPSTSQSLHQAFQSLQRPRPHSRCSAPGPHSCCSPPGPAPQVPLTVAAAPHTSQSLQPPKPSQSLQRPTVTPDPRGWVRTPVRTEAGRRRATTGAGGVSCLNVLPKCSAKCSA